MKAMEENKKSAAGKRSIWKNLKGEFQKIIWPDRDSLIRQTVAVLGISVALGVVIALLDMVSQFGLKFII